MYRPDKSAGVGASEVNPSKRAKHEAYKAAHRALTSKAWLDLRTDTALKQLMTIYYGQNSAATTPEERDRFNGILFGFDGFAVQGHASRIDRPDFGPAGMEPVESERLQTFIANNPHYFGKYHPERRKHIFTKGNCEKSMYLVSSRPLKAPWDRYPKDIDGHFSNISDLFTALNLFGKTTFLASPWQRVRARLKRREPRRRPAIIYSSMHYGYAVLERNDGRFDVYVKAGRGKLAYGGDDFVKFSYWRLSLGRLGLYKKFNQTPFKSSDEATRAFMEDWEGNRMTPLWNGKSLSKNPFHRSWQAIQNFRREKEYRPAIAAVSTGLISGVADIVVSLTTGKPLDPAIAAYKALIAAPLGALVEAFFEDFIVKHWRRNREDADRQDANKNMENSRRDDAYIYHNMTAKNKGYRRPAKKIDAKYGVDENFQNPDTGIEVIRLKACHSKDDVASTIHYPLDLIEPTDPSTPNRQPHVMAISSWFRMFQGNLYRIVCQKERARSYIVRSVAGMASLVVDEGIPGREAMGKTVRDCGKSNVTHYYTIFNEAAAMRCGNQKLMDSYAWLRPHFRGARGAQDSAGNDLEGQRVAWHITIDRKKSSLIATQISEGEFSLVVNSMRDKIETEDSQGAALARLRDHLGLAVDEHKFIAGYDELTGGRKRRPSAKIPSAHIVAKRPSSLHEPILKR